MIQPNNEDLKDSEIKQAFELLEKKRLKQLFNDLDSKQSNEAASILPMFTWMKFAIAASVFGLIITSGVLYFQKGKEVELAYKSKEIGINPLIVLLNDKKIKQNNTKSVILKDNSFGFAQKQQNVSITVFEIGKRLDTLISVAKNIKEPILKKRFDEQVDSLKGLINSYEFNSDEFKIYLRKNELVSIFIIENKYYIRLDKLYYEIKVGNYNKIKLIDNKKDIEKLNRIYFINNIE